MAKTVTAKLTVDFQVPDDVGEDEARAIAENMDVLFEEADTFGRDDMIIEQVAVEDLFYPWN